MRRELSATIQTSDYAIDVTPLDGDRFRVVIDGRVLEVDAVHIRAGTWSLLVAGRQLVIDIDRAGAKVSLASTAGAVTAEIDDARRRRLAKATQAGRPRVSGEELSAPIAGRVVKLLVELGDQVVAGQGVIVLEAMKMENEIKADRGGTISRIHVQAGQSVDTQALLVTLT